MDSDNSEKCGDNSEKRGDNSEKRGGAPTNGLTRLEPTCDGSRQRPGAPLVYIPHMPKSSVTLAAW